MISKKNVFSHKVFKTRIQKTAVFKFHGGFYKNERLTNELKY